MTSAIIRKSSFFLLGGMATAAGWGVYTAGNIFDKMKESQIQEGNNPVAISATAPARDGITTLPFTTTSHLRRTANRIGAASPALVGDNPMSLPTTTMNSTSLFAHGGTIAPQGTSSRSVTRSSGVGNASQIRSTAEDAKRTQPISRGGSMLALSSSTMITSPGAANAAAIATMAVNSASMSSGPRKEPDLPDVPFPTPVPVGDVAWALMALLAAAYAVFTTRAVRKARQKEK